MFVKGPLPFFFLMAFVATDVHAAPKQSYNEKFGVRAQSLGGAYRAFAAGNDAIYYNPAAMSSYKRFGIDLDYAFQSRFPSDHWAGVSIVDSETSLVSAGVDYHAGFLLQNERIEIAHSAALALSVPLLDEYLLAGITGKYLFLPKTSEDGKINNFTMDAGLFAGTPMGLSIAAVGYNLIPVRQNRAPIGFGLGAAWQFGSKDFGSYDSSNHGLTVAFDWLMNDLASEKVARHQFSGGLEYIAAGIIPIRGGYTYEKDSDSHTLSLGTGLFLSFLGIDVLYQQDLKNYSERSFGGAFRFIL